jgi:protoheme IX farnesyltransferase
MAAGVTLLAAGGSALNQVMERDIDRLMVRTRRRPLPQGDLTPAQATTIGAAAILAGLLVLAAGGGLLPPLLGGAAVAWYLVVYTPLKRRTPFALVVGAFCGAVPPVIGWCSAGGGPGDYRIMLLAGLLYLWQVPHFWLLQRRHADDYRRAGIPLLEPLQPGGRLCRLWLVALAAAALLLPVFGIVSGEAARWYLVVPVGLGILACSRSERVVGPCINLFPVLVTMILAIQR